MKPFMISNIQILSLTSLKVDLEIVAGEERSWSGGDSFLQGLYHIICLGLV